jgi:uncharacterized protein involved in exopolysaccharide biosynthesis
MLTFMPTAFALIALAVKLVLPREYTTVTSFAPASSPMSVSQLSGLAAQFGLSFPTDDPTQSPLFYSDLIKTNQFLRKLATATYRTRPDTAPASFISLAGIDEGSQGETLDKSITVLREDVLTVEPDRQTGVVKVTIRTEWPAVSAQIGEALLRNLDEFNVEVRRRAGRAEQDFARLRADSAARELRTAEDALQSFLVGNRAYQQDAALVLQHDRLTREVGLHQELYTGLVQAYEQARLQAVRDTPSITVVEAPSEALRADRRHILVAMIGSFFAGLLFASGLVWLKQYFAKASATNPDNIQELSSLVVATRQDLAALLSPKRRRRTL